MKTIGLIGGMSWQSTAEYYRLANELVARRLGGLHSAKLLLASLDFDEIESLQVDGAWAKAGRILAGAARTLEGAGADMILLCTNTMHKVASDVQDATTVPFVHIGDTTAEAVLVDGLDTVGLLGTRFTMDQGFLRDRLQSRGIDVLVPGNADRALVDCVIYQELVHGHFRDESRAAFLSVIERLRDAGAQGVILGCTEIELLIGDDAPAAIPVYPTTRLHIEAGVDAALTGPIDRADRGTEACLRLRSSSPTWQSSASLGPTQC